MWRKYDCPSGQYPGLPVRTGMLTSCPIGPLFSSDGVSDLGSHPKRRNDSDARYMERHVCYGIANRRENSPADLRVCVLGCGLAPFGKRELVQLNPFDLVVLLTLSNTVQNAIIGDDNSVTGGII